MTCLGKLALMLKLQKSIAYVAQWHPPINYIPTANMLTELPVELVERIASHGTRRDLFNLRLTSRRLQTSLSDSFYHRFFQELTPHYTTHSLELLLKFSRAARIRDAVQRLNIVAVEPLYRDCDALQKPIRPQVIMKRAESLARQNRHHRSTSKPPPVSDTTKFSSDWLSLQESINEQCASMFKEALANLARAQQPATLSLRYIPSKWDGYGFNFVTPAALARFVGAADASYFCLDDPVRTLVPLLSMASEIGLPTVGIELDRGFHNRYWGVSTFEPLLQVPPSTLTNLCKLKLALTMTAADLDNDRDEGLRYMLSLATSLAELNISFCHMDRCFLSSGYMSVLAHCISDAPLTSLSITNGHMCSDGLGELLEPHRATLRTLQLHFVAFGDDDDSAPMFERVSAFPVLVALDLVGLTQRGADVAIDMETLGSVFSARGRTAVREMWRKFLACYRVE
jgi:hypothetical protein